MIDKEMLKNFAIFSDIPQECLSEMVQWGKVIEFNPNETVFQNGESASDVYGVVEGAVELSLVVKDKILKTDIKYEESIQTHMEIIEKDIIVGSIGPGEIFGWSAFIKPRLFTTTARCSRATRVISLPADKIKGLFDRNLQVGYVFMEQLSEIISQRLRDRTDKLIESWSQAFDVSRV